MPTAATDTWEDIRARVLARDGYRCTAGRLLGGPCSRRLDVHHLIPRGEGGTDQDSNLVTLCAACHPRLEALRRYVYRRRGWRRCSHGPGVHIYPGSRESCERTLNRGRTLAAA